MFHFHPTPLHHNKAGELAAYLLCSNCPMKKTQIEKVPCTTKRSLHCNRLSLREIKKSKQPDYRINAMIHLGCSSPKFRCLWNLPQSHTHSLTRSFICTLIFQTFHLTVKFRSSLYFTLGYDPGSHQWSGFEYGIFSSHGGIYISLPQSEEILVPWLTVSYYLSVGSYSFISYCPGRFCASSSKPSVAVPISRTGLKWKSSNSVMITILRMFPFSHD